jgi:hypothetical protein
LIRGAKTASGQAASYGLVVKGILAVMVPLALTVGSLGTAWWYVVIYNAPAAVQSPAQGGLQPLTIPPAVLELMQAEAPQELGTGADVKTEDTPQSPDAPPQELGSPSELSVVSAAEKIPEGFYTWFWIIAALCGVLLAIY